MLSFLKKNKSEKTPKEKVAVQPITGTVMRTMPEKFFAKDEGSPFWTPFKLWSIAIFVIVVLIGVTYWLVSGIPTTSPTVADQQPASLSVTSPQPKNTTPTTPTALPGNAEVNDTAAIAPEPVSPTQSDAIPAPPPAPLPALLPSSTDTDSDGLTDVEELLYGTNPEKPDSDTDGYGDLEELKNGYDPLGAGKLSTTKLLISYHDGSNRFTANYPASWNVQPVGKDGIQFISATGESIAVLVQGNSKALPLTDWYRASVNGGDSTTPPLEMVGEHTGIFAPDRQTFYVASTKTPTTIYAISLASGAKTNLDFRATYELFIQWFHEVS
ncbi:hypothetical protein COV04_00920 [Candidatus Uhrbacteria bacterium CG10_big_fil_rev_8_21_14_0_10_48_11]|uniref:Uncharacterized protein n=1 Tax=Candidatus Uhrbacteria bacterium CG10_big_fil_rev_8_21_14_0_10_48_11 TaxID=1975037 RepID=A0A2M8LF54_9BACT|nr:MAG: hypothetical protein COV04_00920 [Candidatus Uhrbacteria bacterium CG10_big_fil_rev_8_21_14_0_10_48_11]